MNFQAEAESLLRQRQLAEAMQQQYSKPLPTGQMAGRYFVGTNPLQYLAQALQEHQAEKKAARADASLKALGEQREARKGADMSLLAKALSGRQAQPAGMMEDASGNVTPTDPIAAQTPVQSLAQAMPMLGADTQGLGFQALQGAQTRADQQAYQAAQAEENRKFRASESDLARQGREAQMAAAQAAAAQRSADERASRETMSREGNATRVAVAQTAADAAAQRQREKAEEKKGVVFNQDQAMLSNFEGGMDRLNTAAQEVLRHPGLSGITGIRGKVPNIPGSDAANAAAKLQTLKAQVGFGVLQEMRNASKTGGALGAVTEKELGFLQNAIAALDTAQDADQFRESLQKIMDYAAAAKARTRGAFTTKHSDRIPQQPDNGGWKITPVGNGGI